MSAARRIGVAVGLIVDTVGRVLVNRRRPDTHRAGAWEFPGGKLRPDETAEAALIRELREEIGIEVLRAEPLLVIAHDYPERRVKLEIFRVLEFAGQPAALEGQELLWAGLAELEALDLLEADRPIIDELKQSLISRGSA